MKHVQLTIFVDPPGQETAMGILLPFSPTGFEQHDEQVVAYFEETAFDAPGISAALGDLQFDTKTIDEQNWNALWEQNFSPIVINSFCAIRAHFHPPQPGVVHDIIITPKMSFGTGHHATTAMMVEAMEHIPFKDRSVLDFGTGTGILAILAEKMGAARVVAIDVDEWSVENTRENMIQNGTARIEVLHTTQLPVESFDVIVANINRNVLLEYMSGLKQRLTLGAQLLLSGILKSDEQDLIDSCSSNGLLFVARKSNLDWSMLLFEHHG